MYRYAPLLPLTLVLVACGEEPAPEPAPSVAPTPTVTVPALTQELFAQVFAQTCPAASEPVSTSACQRSMGADTASCEFGVGEDDTLRHDAVLEINEAGDGWTFQDAEALCSEHDSHHVDI